ncbi:MAG: AbrB/MazE/SpoVT family DNA-binding domain-containing protein [Alphaproteobacteria bacterium]|nr:AbrB/MazE/SpoVT family DNA-binding domain-containing protein [Alphaproteobacteria bacterium]
MTTLKIRKVGNSYGVILPKEVLARLKIGDGDSVVLTETQEGYQLATTDEVFEAGLKAYERTRKRYRNTLRELAK